MSPAARFRLTLAGLVVASLWWCLGGAAAAQEAESSAEPEPTTTTVPAAQDEEPAPPPTTTTTAPPARTDADDVQAILAGEDPLAVAWARYQAQPRDRAEAPAADAAADATSPVVVAEPTGMALIPEGAAAIDVITDSGDLPSVARAPVPSTATAPGAAAPTVAGEDGSGGVRTGDGPQGASSAPSSSSESALSAVQAPTGVPQDGSLTAAASPVVLPSLLGGQTIASDPAAGSTVTGQAENPERGPPASIATGNATATGNRSATTIDQKNILIVTDEGPVSISTAYNPATGEGAVAAALPDGDVFGVNTFGVRAAAGLGAAGGGDAQIHTGDATATGNASDTTINQTNLVVVTADDQGVSLGQSAAVANLGVAGADTGGNSATAGNAGDGSASIVTGNATAVGNQSRTVINQTNFVVVTGEGSSVDLDQRAQVDNVGVADANTGGNTAQAGGSDDSGGSAVISTGNATATGNLSTTVVTQRTNAIVTGDRSAVIANQDAAVTNDGTASATTGSNTAVGGGGDGSASVDSGNATATGNQSTTTVDQSVFVLVLGEGSTADVGQASHVDNVGRASADTGGNLASSEAA
jgi:hypothetical protein